MTLELSLSALIRKYDIAQIPITWEGRTWGCSKLKLREMGRKYLCTLLMLFFQKMLLQDDVLAEKVAAKAVMANRQKDLEDRVRHLESIIEQSRDDARTPPETPAAQDQVSLATLLRDH